MPGGNNDQPMLPQFQSEPFQPTESTVDEDEKKRLVLLRQALFQAICDECEIAVGQATKDERACVNRTVGQILEPPEATAEDVHRVATAIAEKSPHLELTPNVIRMRWGKYVGDRAPKLQTINYGVQSAGSREERNAVYQRNANRLARMSDDEVEVLRRKCGLNWRGVPLGELACCDDLAGLLGNGIPKTRSWANGKE